MSDQDVLVRNFAKKVTTKFPLRAQTPQAIPISTIIAIIMAILQILMMFPIFKPSLKSYADPGWWSRWILRRSIKKAVSQSGTTGASEEEIELALRMAINDSSEAELNDVEQAIKEIDS